MINANELQDGVVYVVTKSGHGVPAGTLLSTQDNDVLMSAKSTVMSEDIKTQLCPDDIRPATLKDVYKAMV